MKVTYKTSHGRGTLLNPTFRSYDVEHVVLCARTERINNLMYLYNHSGYVITCVAVEDIKSIEQ